MKMLINFLLKKPCAINFRFGFMSVCKCKIYSCRCIHFFKTNIFLGMRKKTCPDFIARSIKYGYSL